LSIIRLPGIGLRLTPRPRKFRLTVRRRQFLSRCSGRHGRRRSERVLDFAVIDGSASLNLELTREKT
jgi:hypothetical protein